MHAAIYNPYLDTLGGGERYTLSLAEILAKNGYQVDVQWKDGQIINSLRKRFGMNLSGINVVPDIKKGDGYDLCFWVSDGSIPLMHARQNWLHFQVPFHGVSGKSLVNKMKLFRINKIICNSQFTKNVIDKEFGVKSVVVYPPVATNIFRPKHKENIILYVGRFSKLLQNKGQDILVSAFKKLLDKNNGDGFSGWKLVLAGGTEMGANEELKDLEKKSTGYPIEIVRSPDLTTLKNLYGKAKIFWSAAGFGQNETKNPEKMEHFGITVVEAMSAGAIPIVYGGGGYKEIVGDGENGYLWNSINELLKKTTESASNRSALSKMAIIKAYEYSYQNFEKNILKLL